MKWLTVAQQPTTFLGMETAAWTVIIAIGTFLVAAFSVFVAWRSAKRADRRDHHLWLQEKRREAYATFLTATRDTYDAIEERGRLAKTPRNTEDQPDPESTELVEARTKIDRNFGQVKRAKDILAIVGPKEMEALGDRVIARMNLDRIYFSPTGWSQRTKEKDRILRYVEVADKDKFFTALSSSYVQGRVDLDRYKAAHHDFSARPLVDGLRGRRTAHPRRP